MAAKHKAYAVQFAKPFVGSALNLNLFSTLSSLEHLPQGRFLKNHCPKAEACAVLHLVFMPALHFEILPHLCIFFFFMWQCYISESCDHLVFCSISSLFRQFHAPSYILITDFLLLQCLIHCVTFSHVKVDQEPWQGG